MKTLKCVSRRVDCCLAFPWEFGWTWCYSCQLQLSSSAGGGRRLRKFTSSPVCGCWSLQPLQIHGCLCFQARNELASVRQGCAGSLAPQLVWPPWHVLVAYKVKTQLRALLIQPPASNWSRLPAQPDPWGSWLQPSSSLSSLWDCAERPPNQFVSEHCLCGGYCGLGNLGDVLQNQAVAMLPWMSMKMELLLSKVFLEPDSPFGKAYISSETSFISVPPLATCPSPHSHSHSHSLYCHPEVLVPSAGTGLPAPCKQPELACFGKMQAHETAWKCECFSRGTEEAMELKPSPDKIQGTFTVMKFFSKNCCLFGTAAQWLFFQ